MAAVGRNHYVVRLGTVAAVGARSIPFLMRDCLTVTVDPESVAVLSGHVPTHHEEPAAVSAAAAAASAAAAGVEARGSSVPRGRGGGGGANGGGGGSVHAGGAIAAALRSREAAKAAAAAHAAAVERASLGNHVSSLVASFANAGKPLVFSLLELRETKRRDHWRALLVEMASAHRLHAALGYGSAGRLTRRAVDAAVADADADGGGAGVAGGGDALGAATAATLKAVSPAMVGGAAEGAGGGAGTYHGR